MPICPTKPKNPAAHGPRRCEISHRSAQRSFKQQACLLLGEALASPKSGTPKPRIPQFCTPCRRQQGFRRKMLRNAGAERRPSPPLRVCVSVLREGGKTRWEISLWPPRARSWIFFGARRPLKMILGAFWGRPWGQEAPESPPDPPTPPPGRQFG